MDITKKKYWSDNGWCWRHDKGDQNFSNYSEGVRKDICHWLERRPLEFRQQPAFWDDLRWNSPSMPVIGITWFEAEAYTKWLKIITGKSFSLPSKLQWEKTVRSGFVPGLKAWDGNQQIPTTHKNAKVRGKPSNQISNADWPFNLIDSVSAIWEWCEDWVCEDKNSSETNPTQNCNESEAGRAYVIRGGPFIASRRIAHCAYRFRNYFDYFYGNIGFRVVLT